MEVPPHYIGREVKCVSCGSNFKVVLATSAPIRVTNPKPSAGGASLTSDKRILPAFILACLFGAFGAHAFYAGRILQGLVYLLMWLGILISDVVASWFPGGAIFAISIAAFTITDIIRIVVGFYQDGNGSKITQWT
jgi:TM2 domain-containing membrane protein YozV